MRWARLWIFPTIFIILFISIGWANIDILRKPDNISSFYLQNFSRGYVGYGQEGNYDNGISFADLEVGDILLGGYPKCAYGRFSHVSIYMGENLVLEGFGDLGVTIQPIYHYWNYSEIALLKVDASPEIKEKVVNYLKQYEGGLFYPTAFRAGDRIWNCSKIIWLAYYKEGIDLDDSGDLWIAPDNFYASSWTKVIREKGR